MGARARILAFGSAAALVVAGGLCAALVEGLTGEVLTIVLMSAGLGGAVLLAFVEVGLSEERERAREEEQRGRGAGTVGRPQPRPRLSRRPRRPG